MSNFELPIIPDYIGAGYIGQEKAKKTINFQIHSQRQRQLLEPILITSQRGSGKTAISRLLAKSLLNKDGSPKRAIEINGANLQKLSSFVSSVIIPHVANDQEITLIIEEVHITNLEILTWLLSALTTDTTGINRVQYEDSEFVFDFRKFHFIATTTNPEKLPKAFLSRMARVELEFYQPNELVAILHKNTPNIQFVGKIEEQIISVARKSPRETVKLAKNLIKYCEQKGNFVFSAVDWTVFKDIFNIRTLGLINNELEILRYLSQNGPQPLRGLAAKLGVDSKTVQQDYELFLLSEGLIKVSGQRLLTMAGQRVLDLENGKT